MTRGDEGGERGGGVCVATLRGRHQERSRVPRLEPRAFVVRVHVWFGHRGVIDGVGEDQHGESSGVRARARRVLRERVQGAREAIGDLPPCDRPVPVRDEGG